MKTTWDQLFSSGYWNERGYVVGLGRDHPHPKKSHLYRGSFSEVGDPCCHHGWNRGKDEYSIWRNNVGRDGICWKCIRAARKEMEEEINMKITVKICLDGNAWFATYDDFIDLHESPAGFGNTPSEALKGLIKTDDRFGVLLEQAIERGLKNAPTTI